MNNDKMQDLATRLKQRYGIAYTVGYNTTVHYGLDKHPLIAEAIAALSPHGQESEAQVVGFRITSKNGAVSLTLREPDAYELRECKIEPVVLADSVVVQEPEWISVEDNLPHDGVGIPYMSFMTEPVLVKGKWREDYPIVAHFIFETTNEAMGCNAPIKFNHEAGYKSYSVRCPFIDVDNLGPKFRNKLPAAFTYAVTHWMPLPASPTLDKE